jgi:stearoyl-CoA desaturase (Delta-9 desaturase)
MIPSDIVASNSIRRGNRRHALAMVTLGTSGVILAAGLPWCGVAPTALDVVIAATYTATIAIGSIIGFHRLLSHRSFETTPALRRAFAILGCMTMEGPPIFWAALHRRHHEASDRRGDPHSPYVRPNGTAHRSFWKGVWHAYMGWMFQHEMPNPLRYTPDLLRDPVVLGVNRHYVWYVLLGLALPVAFGWVMHANVLGALSMFVWAGLLRLWFCHNMTWYITSLAHVTGRRDFESRDESRNSAWMAVPTFGESWHNTHHAFPGAAYLAAERWQLDLSGLVILALEKLGLAWNVRRLQATDSRGARTRPLQGPRTGERHR